MARGLTLKLAGKRLSLLADSKMRIQNSTIEEFCSTYILLLTLHTLFTLTGNTLEIR